MRAHALPTPPKELRVRNERCHRARARREKRACPASFRKMCPGNRPDQAPLVRDASDTAIGRLGIFVLMLFSEILASQNEIPKLELLFLCIYICACFEHAHARTSAR